MMDKLYEEDSYKKRFGAVVIGCDDIGGGDYRIILDRTAFYPEGGGQRSDTGFLIAECDAAFVKHVKEKNGVIEHIADKPLMSGEPVGGVINWTDRYSRMQNHTGEHIVSGIVRRLFGFENVGFHMGSEYVTIDFDGELAPDDIVNVETLANEAVYGNLPVSARYFSPDAISTIDYRSKKALAGDIRIVTVPGYDACACCGTHVAKTGEVGVIKVVTVQRYKGGSRLSMLCGTDALNDYRFKNAATYNISSLLSAKPGEIVEAVERLQSVADEYKKQLADYKMRYLKIKAEALRSERDTADKVCNTGNICVFEDDLDQNLTRQYCIYLSELAPLAAVFSPKGEAASAGVSQKDADAVADGSSGSGGNDSDSGNSGSGDIGGSGSGECEYRYSICSKEMDARVVGREFNTTFNGRGGGTERMVEGSVTALRGDIEAFFK